MYFSAFQAILIMALSSGIALTSAEGSTDDPVDQEPKVENGKPVHPPHSRPNIAQVHQKNKHIYAGIIVDEWTIATTCHSIPAAVRIFAGKYYRDQTETSQQERTVCWYSEHPKHGSDNVAESFNICLIHLSVPLVFDEFVQPGVFPNPKGDVPEMKNCKLTGWGNVKGTGSAFPPELREAQVAMKPTGCKYKHSSLTCLDRGACWNDWGSAVTCNDNLTVVLAYVTRTEYQCEETVAVHTMHIRGEWFDKAIVEATKKCRPKIDCCNTGGTISGNPAVPHSRPYVVQIHSKGSKQITTGVLINAYTILASILKADDVLKVTAGKHSFNKYEGTQQVRRTCSISKHTEFGNSQNAFGYALIHLSDPFVFNEYVNAISIAPKGYIPKSDCSIIAWKGNASEIVLREQLVKFIDPTKCKDGHATVSCVEAGACLHDWGSPVICSHDSKIYLHAITFSAEAYCKDGLLASIPELPRSWLATELRNAENNCGKSVL